MKLFDLFRSRRKERLESIRREIFPEVNPNSKRLMLWDICNREFALENLYAMGGSNGTVPNARAIAHQYGVELEFRHSYYSRGLSCEGHCLSAFLVGEDLENLKKAREDIYLFHGIQSVEGSIDIDGKTILY